MAKTVRAIAKGFYKGERKRAGAIFQVPDKATSKWFEDVELQPVKEAVAKQEKPKAK